MKGLILAFCLFAFGTYAQGAIGDRLILEVNKVSYTQRQMELYVTLRSILRAVDGQDIIVVGTDNWSMYLEQFRRDMMVEQEAQRLGSFQPDRKTILEAEKIVNAQKEQNLILAKFLERMGASSLSVRKSLAQVIRVYSFLASKSNNTAPGQKARVDENWYKEEWFTRLEERLPYRFYAYAIQYVEIAPPGSK